jgi:multiple sugar transport system substrate-binding protein
MVFAPAYGTSQVIYYNKAVAKELGLDASVFSSWQNLAAARGRVVGFDTGKNKIKYVWEPMWGPDNIADIARSAGGKYLSDDGRTVTINSPEWVEVCEQLRAWLHDDKIMAIHWGGQGWEYWYKTMDDWVYGLSLGYTGSPGDYAIALKAVQKSAEEGCKTSSPRAPAGWKGRDPRRTSAADVLYSKSKGLTEAQKKAPESS